MGTYRRPKARLHHEFLYLNHETVLNALSALEAGAVDEIITKTSEAKEGGLNAELGAGPAKAGAGKKKQSSIHEELVRTRTWFSAYDSWYSSLKSGEALGTFDEWDASVRDQLEIGDTIEFDADVLLSPVHKVLATYMSFASGANKPGSPFQLSQAELKEAKQISTMMATLISGREGRRNLPVYLLPGGVAHPRIVARLDETFIIGGLDNVEGRFTIVAQVDALLGPGQQASVVRIIRDAPPTPREVEVTTEALAHMIDAGQELGVEFTEEDLTFSHPTVIVRPIAIFK